MPTVTKVDDLKINKLTKAQYDAAIQAGTIGENEISIITDLDEFIQVDTMPTADASLEGKIYQFIGTTDQNYTNGYFYKCVSDGAVTPTYSWERIDVQPAPVIPDPLPSQTGQSGKFLTTDGTDASWSSVSSSVTGTLLANNWTLDSNKYKQTVNVTGVTANNDVFVSPFASDAEEWGDCGVFGATQAAGTITFWADTEPTNDLQFTATILA